jgi:hypothetical protein
MAQFAPSWQTIWALLLSYIPSTVLPSPSHKDHFSHFGKTALAPDLSPSLTLPHVRDGDIR